MASFFRRSHVCAAGQHTVWSLLIKKVKASKSLRKFLLSYMATPSHSFRYVCFPTEGEGWRLQKFEVLRPDLHTQQSKIWHYQNNYVWFGKETKEIYLKLIANVVMLDKKKFFKFSEAKALNIVVNRKLNIEIITVSIHQCMHKYKSEI